jgi:hypothetical protein
LHSNKAWALDPATLLSMSGLLSGRMLAAALIFVSILVFFPVIYYLVQFGYRYQLPILWILSSKARSPHVASLAMSYIKTATCSRGRF